MHGLINLFVRRPVTVIMILSALLIAAGFSVSKLPLDKLPEFSVPRVNVETVYSGMAAGDIRALVTIPVEDALSPVKGLQRIRSISRDNYSLISMDFRWGTDPMTAAVLVREAIDAVYPGLPEGVHKPIVTSAEANNEPHAIVSVYSRNNGGSFARNLAEYELRTRLRRIDGASSVILVGGEVAEEQLQLDVSRLAALGLSPQEFTRLLSQEAADIPAGTAREGKTELIVVSSGRPDSVSELRSMILPLGAGTLKAGDAGSFITAAGRRDSIFVHNGIEAAALEIYRRPGADPVRLSREIQKVVKESNSLFSRDADVQLVYDSTPSLTAGIKGLLISAGLGAAAVIFVLIIFIRRVLYSLLVAFSIPVSAAAGICVLFILGKSLNGMSLGGLALGIGLVSDVSVIVLDLLCSSFDNKNNRPEPQEISKITATIAGSSFASTMTTILVFAPIIFLPGPLGSLFGDIAITLVVSVFTGWLYAQFCLPSLYRMFFKYGMTANIQKPIKLKYLSMLNNINPEKKYRSILIHSLRRPVKIFTVAALASAIGALILLLQPVTFIRADEAEEVRISAVFPSGTLPEAMSNAGTEISRIVSGLPMVETVFGRAGAENEDVGRRAEIDYRREELILSCTLKRGARPAEAVTQINSALEQFFDREFSYYVHLPRDRTEVLLGLSSHNSFVVSGKDREEALDRCALVENFFNTAAVPALIKSGGQRPELRMYPNREAAAYLALPAINIAETLYTLNEGVVAVTLEIEGRPLDVRVTGAGADNSAEEISFLENIPLKTPEGKTVFLGSVGRVERRETEAALARLDRSDVVYMDIAAAAGKTAVKLIKEITSRHSWFSGADESVFSLYRNSLIVFVLLVLILLYMAMGAQFESFLLPVILMMSIPLSLSGAGPALLISGAGVDSGAVMGLAALFGLVVNNSLVLFEISEEKINQGVPVSGAVYTGACERLRAVLITALTTVFALLPLVIRPLMNSQKSMAAAMMGGLAASTILSLFVIPPVLIRFFKWRFRKGENFPGGSR
ncbi:MAG: efflux RND transporter permease subunit [Treponema sp.]|nr:efflux RND transporter permease subunit [Treponema sp.]